MKTTASGLFKHVFYIRRGLPVKLLLPLDIRPDEAERLARFVQILPLDSPRHSRREHRDRSGLAWSHLEAVNIKQRPWWWWVFPWADPGPVRGGTREKQA